MRRFPLALLVALVGAGVVAAQQPSATIPTQQPAVTFRTETNFVEVHAIVTDQKGAFVRELTRDDFEIYEDGKLQTATVFSLVDVPVEQPFVPANADGPIEPDVRATTRTFDGRVYIILLDDLHTILTRTNNVRDVAKKFVDEYLGVNDLAAVVFTSGRQESGQELTGSRRLLKAAIDRFQGQKLPSAGAEKLAVHLRQAGDAAAMADGSQESRTSEGLHVEPFSRSRTSRSGSATSRVAARRCCSSVKASTTTSTSPSISAGKVRRSSPRPRRPRLRRSGPT